MRKVLSLLLCVAMLCSLVVITAQADATAAASFASVTVVPNSEVTIDMKVLNNPGIAAIKFVITETTDGTKLNPSFAGVDNGDDTLGLTANDPAATYFWSGAYDVTTETIGSLTLSIPEDAAAGVYTFAVAVSNAANTNKQYVTVADTTFTVTVTDKVITGVNVAIDAGLAIGVHVQAADIEGVSITAVDVEGKAFKTVEAYEDGEDGDYIFYLNVNPWDMNKTFTVDFTDNFEITGDELNLDQLPATAKTTGILAYCNAVLAGASDELVQLIADLLAYGQAAQTYKGVAVMTLPDGLTPTVGEWLDSEENACDFGTYCSENFPADLTGKNSTAKKKFEFASATINFGAKFVVTFTIQNGATATASNLARIKVDGDTFELDGWNFTYAFSPAQYPGVEFDLYAAANTSGTNFAWINNYGPAHYAAYVADSGAEGSAEILAVLEAFYLYGVSVEAYVATLG